MSQNDGLIAVAVVLAAAWLSRPLALRAQVALWLTVLLVSVALFLPMSVLRAPVPPYLLAWLESTVDALSWTLEDVGHGIAFASLALVLWSLRPDLRGWRIISVMLVLAVGSELLQGLTAARSMAISDIGIDLLGAAIGLALGARVSGSRKAVHARGTANDTRLDVES